jgi:Aspartyl/Asparaginyl beta-hydroxylase
MLPAPPEIATPRNTISEAESEARLTHDRTDVLALVAKADHRRDAGEHRAANAYYAAAVQLGGSKQLDHKAEAELLRAQAAINWLADVFKHHLLTNLAKAGYPRETLHPRLRKSLDIMLGATPRSPEYREYPQKPVTHFYPDTDYLMFADTSSYDWVPRLEAEFAPLREEAMSLVMGHDSFTPYIKIDKNRPQSNHFGLLENSDWSTLYLWENGAPVAAHVQRSPKIFQAVMDHVPLCHIGPRAPSIMLSLLRPGARIPPHTGALNSRLICHLPLIVPHDCGFRVGSQMIEWQEGKVIAFDDSVEHEAWNNSKFDRLVLIFDIWRPELTEEEREQITAMFAVVDSYR